MAKMGRPKIEINIDLVKQLANIQCTHEEIAGVLGVSRGTLLNRPDYLAIYKNGQETGKSSLRRTQFRLAETSAAMAIWLGKQYLGQAEKIEIVNNELMKEELELIPSNGRFNVDMKSRIDRFITNQ